MTPEQKNIALQVLKDELASRQAQGATTGTSPSIDMKPKGFLPTAADSIANLPNVLNFAVGRTSSPEGTGGEVQKLLNRAMAERAIGEMYPTSSDIKAKMDIESARREQQQIQDEINATSPDTFEKAPTLEPLASSQVNAVPKAPQSASPEVIDVAGKKFARIQVGTERDPFTKQLKPKYDLKEIKEDEVKAAEAGKLANYEDAISHKQELMNLLFTTDAKGNIVFKEYTKDGSTSNPKMASQFAFGKFGYEGQRINDLMKELEQASVLTRRRTGAGGMEGPEGPLSSKGLLGGYIGFRQNPKALYDKLTSDYDTILSAAKGVGGKIVSPEISMAPAQPDISPKMLTATNPTTKQRIKSLDGGVTWQPA